MVQALLFVIPTLILAVVSRRSLLLPRSHGFYRFFAWEAILALILMNGPIWFHDPFHWHQLISWVLLILSLVPLVLGILWLRRRGMPRGDGRREPELLGFERTTTLVSDGIFGLIRHPLYSSLLLLTWGVFFKEPSAEGGTLALAATILLVVTAKRDEAECVRTFGAQYERYMQRTRMFIPHVL